MEQTRSPREIDEQLAALSEQASKLAQRISSLMDRIHLVADDREDWRGKRQVWRRTYAEVLRDVQYLASHENAYVPLVGKTPREILEAETSARSALAQTMTRIQELDAIYDASPWSRFFPCDTRDGHIHSSERGCSTVRPTTAMLWRPDLSGKTMAEAVADLGEALCTFCYPDARSEWKTKTLGQVRDERTRTERDRLKAERETQKAAKRLARDEIIWGGHDRFCDRIETVAAAKDALRHERELFYYYGRGPHPDHPAWEWAAGRARAVLLLREARHEGWGATQGEIDRIIAAADKKHAKLAQEA